jgi:peptidoglycan/xylan/chitin deacetylase (PgdA/CDA1 family)
MTILTYHAVDPGWTAALSVPPERFAEQVRWIAAHRRVVPLHDLLGGSPAGGSRDAVALTFDDGFASVYEHAVPVLRALELPFTVFLIGKMHDGSGATVDWVDRPPGHPLRTLETAQIRELRAEGVRFGSHSYAHLDMTTLGYERARADLVRSREVLEELLGEPVTTLAYPRGRHDDDVRRAAADAGFAWAFGLAVPPQAVGPRAVPRVGVYPKDRAPSLRVKTQPAYARFRASSPYPWLRRRIERIRPGAPSR